MPVLSDRTSPDKKATVLHSGKGSNMEMTRVVTRDWGRGGMSTEGTEF